jgi:hypothetical protein
VQRRKPAHRQRRSRSCAHAVPGGEPWRPNKAKDSSTISDHEIVEDEFAEIDRWTAELLRGASGSDAIEMAVVDFAGRLIPRRHSH